jgi:hypothetical protein
MSGESEMASQYQVLEELGSKQLLCRTRAQERIDR